MKLNKAFLLGAMALATFSSCGSSNSTENPGAAVANANETAVDEGGQGPALGTPAAHMDVTNRMLMVDGAPVDRADENHFQGFPMLASRVSEAWLATRAISTTQGNLEVYDNNTLLFVVSNFEGTPSISYSRSGFMADSISWSASAGSGDQGQNLRNGLLKLSLSECMVEDKAPEQDKGEQDQGEKAPDQGQDKGEQDQGEKAPDQGEKAPDQGQDKGEQDKGEKAPDQGQDKGEQDQGEKAPDQGEKAPEQRICKTAVVELSFQEIISKEPDQGQKAPDQGEKAPDQGEKAPDQGEKAPDQGEKAPDQGEKAPDQGEKAPDQGEKAPDQGQKEEPVKEEPKQEQPKQEEPVKEQPKQGQK